MRIFAVLDKSVYIAPVSEGGNPATRDARQDAAVYDSRLRSRPQHTNEDLPYAGLPIRWTHCVVI